MTSFGLLSLDTVKNIVIPTIHVNGVMTRPKNNPDNSVENEDTKSEENEAMRRIALSNPTIATIMV
jgi:hypothetical protein